jgi:hypothetical protein
MVKGDRLERQDSFTGLGHWLDLFLKPLRRTHRAQLPCGIYHHCNSVCVSGRDSTNASDKGIWRYITKGRRTDTNGVVVMSTAQHISADAHIASPVPNSTAGIVAYSYVQTSVEAKAYVGIVDVNERTVTNRRVA